MVHQRADRAQFVAPIVTGYQEVVTGKDSLKTAPAQAFHCLLGRAPVEQAFLVLERGLGCHLRMLVFDEFLSHGAFAPDKRNPAARWQVARQLAAPALVRGTPDLLRVLRAKPTVARREFGQGGSAGGRTQTGG